MTSGDNLSQIRTQYSTDLGMEQIELISLLMSVKPEGWGNLSSVIMDTYIILQIEQIFKAKNEWIWSEPRSVRSHTQF